MNKSETIAQLADALSKAQGEMEAAKKDSANPFFKSKYADLASVWEACRAPLAKYGLSVAQMPETTPEGQLILSTILMHSSGEWLASTLMMRPVKDDPQGVGSVITYMRRYALSAAVGISPEDDDGNAASAKKPGTTEVPVAVAPLKKREVAAPEPAPAAAPAPTGFIDKGQQANFARTFREALIPELQSSAESMRHEWLVENKYVNGEGLPSASGIPLSDWPAARERAVAFAKSQLPF